MNNRPHVEVPDHVPPSRQNEGGSSARSPTPCWTCRRRRVQCDGVLPTCQKCRKAGKDCLGYKKPLVWNTGVASRGKMMGRTFHESKASMDLKASLANSASSESSSPRPSDSRSCSPSSEIDGPKEDRDRDQGEDEGVEEIKRELAISHLFTHASGPGGTLVDPIFQDLKPITRYYLDYCKSSCLASSLLHLISSQLLKNSVPKQFFTTFRVKILSET